MMRRAFGLGADTTLEARAAMSQLQQLSDPTSTLSQIYALKLKQDIAALQPYQRAFYSFCVGKSTDAVLPRACLEEAKKVKQPATRPAAVQSAGMTGGTWLLVGGAAAAGWWLWSKKKRRS